MKTSLLKCQELFKFKLAFVLIIPGRYCEDNYIYMQDVNIKHSAETFSLRQHLIFHPACTAKSEEKALTTGIQQTAPGLDSVWATLKC